MRQDRQVLFKFFYLFERHSNRKQTVILFNQLNLRPESSAVEPYDTK